MKTIKNILYTLTLIMLFVACTSGEEKATLNNETENENPSHNEPIMVTQKQFLNDNMLLGIPTLQPFSKVVKATGMIDVPPYSKSVISSFVSGRVKNVSLLIGDKVKKGQALLAIENISFIELQQNYLEVAEQIDYLKAEYERQKQLFEEKIASQKIFLKAESDYKTMNSRYLGMKKKMELLNINVAEVEKGNLTSTVTIFSPIDGSISKLNVSTGSYVNPTDEIMEIINTNHIHVELNVFEKDAINIKKGQTILFKVSESSNKTYEATVHLVGTQINQETRTVTVNGHLKEEDQNSFLAGMFVDAEILTHEEEKLAIPAGAINETEGGKFLLILKKHTEEGYFFAEKEINTGEILNGFTQILNEKDFVATDSILFKGGYSIVGEESGGGHSH